MPEISRFFGIVISMHYRDHAPPHFHARYGDEAAIVEIGRPGVLAGWLPPRAMGMLLEWAALHREELLANWALARDDAPLRRIEPLG